MGETTKGGGGAALLARIAELEEEVARLRQRAETGTRAHMGDANELAEMRTSHVISGIAAAADRSALEASEAARGHLEQALEATRFVGTWDWDVQGDCLTSDARFARFFSVDPARAAEGVPIGEYVAALHLDDRAYVQAALEAALTQGGEYAAEYRVVQQDGTVRWLSARGQCFFDEQGRAMRFPGVAIDITESKRAENKLIGQKRILEMVATGAPLLDTLDALVRLIEAQEPGMRCGILLVSEDGRYFRRGSGPSLPETYHVALDGVAITPPYLGSCGEAAHQGLSISVPDIASDDRYAGEWCDLLLSHGIRAIRSTPVCNAEGRVLAAFGMHYDHPRIPEPGDPEVMEIATGVAAIVLERHRVEQALRASERRLRAAVEGSPFPIMLHAEDGELLALSRSWAKHSGYTREEIHSHHEWFRLAYPDTHEQAVAALAQEFASEQVVRAGEFTIRAKSGEPRIWDFQAVPLGRLPDGRRLQMSAAMDITERKRAEEALRASEARLRTLADNVPLLCWMAEPDGYIFWYNRRWYEYTGTTPQQMEGWGWQAIQDPDELPNVLEAWKRALAFGEPFDAVLSMKGADGTFRPFLTRAVPVHDEAGHVTRWFGTNTEVKDMVEAREALAQSRAEMERLVEERTAALLREVEERRRAEEALRQGEKMQAIGQLTGGIAHDFNNILQVVASGATLLRHPRLTEERRTIILNGLTKAAENARQLTSHLLAFARKQALQPEVFGLNARLVGMSELLRHTLGSRIRVETDFAADPWPVFVDLGQFEIALLNLAVNARDAMLPEGGTLTLQTHNTYLEATTERAAGEYVCLTVKDSGQGMPPAVLARAFEPFFTTKGPDMGTGLGLAQVHGFAKQSGGDIAIESTLGQGTTITLHLPRAVKGASEDAAPSRARDGAGAAMQQAAGKTVLVVEDNADVATFACSMLEGLGYTTQRADNAADALRLLNSGDPVDAVFSDVVMPGEMNGVQLASILRHQHPRLTVVLATGYSQVLTEWQGKSVAEVLRKPYSLDELAAALEQALAAPEADAQAVGLAPH
jgi:PAS domain S-box-containing protein